MANVNKNGKRLGKVQGWGIVDGELNVLAVSMSRDDLRSVKRSNYAGGDYKLVKIDAVLTHYTK